MKAPSNEETKATEQQIAAEPKDTKAVTAVVESAAQTSQSAVHEALKEVVDIEKTLETILPIQSGKCFYLMSASNDGLVLETALVDKYAPKKTGVYATMLSPIS